MLDRKVTVIGLGYIGLPTSAVLAQAGYTVSGIDINEDVVSSINRGEAHIVEPDLDQAVQRSVASKRLLAYTSPQPGDVYIICVPTPFHQDKSCPTPNLDFVLKAAQGIAPLLKAGDLIILESTSPVGTTQKIADVLKKQGVDLSTIYMAYCPERVLPGKIMIELVENDRVVGGLRLQDIDVGREFYKTFVKGRILTTTAATAEMCKLVENSYRDVNIAFANELSIVCDKIGVDVQELIQLANHHPRVNILQPGPGVGGHCIAVDPWFIVTQDPENTKIIRCAREVNLYKTQWVIKKIKAEADAFEKQKGYAPKIACLGLTYKPDVDDLRESPALEIALTLHQDGYSIIGVDPYVACHDILNVTQVYEPGAADIEVLLVKHSLFLKAQK